MIYTTGLHLQANLLGITDDKEVIIKLRDKEGNLANCVLNKKQVDALYNFAVLAKTFTDIKEQDIQDSYW